MLAVPVKSALAGMIGLMRIWFCKNSQSYLCNETYIFQPKCFKFCLFLKSKQLCAFPNFPVQCLQIFAASPVCFCTAGAAAWPSAPQVHSTPIKCAEQLSATRTGSQVITLGKSSGIALAFLQRFSFDICWEIFWWNSQKWRETHAGRLISTPTRLTCLWTKQSKNYKVQIFTKLGKLMSANLVLMH